MYTFRALHILALSFCLHLMCGVSNAVKRTSESDGASDIDQIQQDLGSRLSSGARIYLAGDAAYQYATLRWSAAQHPDFAAVVVPDSDEDVAVAVQYANSINVPFLAVNRGHGTTIDMNGLHQGINIYLHNLYNITIAPDGESATIGGGVYGDQLIRYLAANGKVAATGACTCTSLLGPGLGGGFGRYQGFYGLVLDNFTSLAVVTANGSIITASDDINPDLFWAMRGAATMSIPDWWVASYTYTKDQMDNMFTALGDLNANGTQTKELTTYTVLAFDLEVSTAEPVITVCIYFAGPATQAFTYAQPFLDLNPIKSSNQSVPYTDLADAVGTGTSSLMCHQSNTSAASFPVGLLEYNISSIHTVYDIFSELVSNHPDFAESVVQFEAYPVQKMQSVDYASTAYAHREDNLLVSLLALYHPSPSNDALAPLYGNKIRDAFHTGDRPGREMNTYVNYAYGDESTEQMYGFEGWRGEKLRRLKREWDPWGAFGWFHPIR